jgi:predicted dienelactone hydrolase
MIKVLAVKERIFCAVNAVLGPMLKRFSARKLADMVIKKFIALLPILSFHFEPPPSAASWIPTDNDS